MGFLTSSFWPDHAFTGAEQASLERLLRQLFAEGAAAWPGVILGEEQFARRLGEATPRDLDPARHLLSLRAIDLYLSTACGEGLPGALEAFDRELLSLVPRYVARIDGSPAFADEVRQLLRERLFLGGDPKIRQYSGSGSLAGWLRVAATRTALNLRRSKADQPYESLDDRVVGDAVRGDPELAHIRARYQSEFNTALRDAFARLSKEERHVLRLHHAGGLSGDRIAAMIDRSRATVVRRLSTGRESLARETRRLLSERLRLDAAEFESLIRAIMPDFEMSLSGVLKSGEPATKVRR